MLMAPLKDSFKRHDSDLKRLPARKGGVARRVEVTEPRNRTQHFDFPIISSISPFLLVGFLTPLKDNA